MPPPTGLNPAVIFNYILHPIQHIEIGAKMVNDETRNKIKDIIGGSTIHWQTDNCTAIRNHLCASFSPGTTVKTDFDRKLLIKKEQARLLDSYIDEHELWFPRPAAENRLLTIGGEAEVYININEQQVIKVNDAVYYSTWLNFLQVYFFIIYYLPKLLIS